MGMNLQSCQKQALNYKFSFKGFGPVQHLGGVLGSQELPFLGHCLPAAGSIALQLWGLCCPHREPAWALCLNLSITTSLFLSSGPRDLPEPESLRRELQSPHLGLAV